MRGRTAYWTFCFVLAGILLVLSRSMAAQQTQRGMEGSLDTLLQQQRWRAAAQRYLHLLTREGGQADSGGRQLAQAHLVAPSGLQGRRLAAWWRRQDPLPATLHNERLKEHLRRVAYARRHYAHPQSDVELDDRGKIYVRYGNPAMKRSIKWNSSQFQQDVFRFGVPVSLADFPENRFWVYSNPDKVGYYLFIKKGGSYQLARTTNELLPSALRHGYSRSERGLNKAVSALAALRHIYRQLALYHIDFSERYTQVDNYLRLQEVRAIMSRNGRDRAPGRQVEVGEGVGQKRTVTTDSQAGMVLPNERVKRTLEQSERADRRAIRRREKHMPHQRGRVRSDVQQLPVASRFARFLEEDGTTRTEVYWGIKPDAEASRSERGQQDRDYVTRVVVQQQDVRYRVRNTYRQLHPMEAAANEGELSTGHTLVVRGDTGQYHMAVQWDQLPAQLAESAEQKEEFSVRTAVRQMDSLEALPRSKHTLTMSDLRPVQGRARGEIEEAPVYPFHTLTPNTSLALYFEAYHLAQGEDGHTHYTVEYEVLRRTERGRWGQIVGGQDAKRTASRMTSTGTERTTQEYVQLDLTDWPAGKQGTLRIAVRLTDETTGQQVERALTFEVNPRK